MSQSEFYERTKVHLSPEQYAEVEKIYDACEMDKDLFCRAWLQIRDNELVYQLCTEMSKRVDKLEYENADFKRDYEHLVNEVEKIRKQNEIENLEQSEVFDAHLKGFGEKIVLNLGDDSRLYDAVEEEFGLGFIIKVKLENDMDLEEHERKYLIQKL